MVEEDELVDEALEEERWEEEGKARLETTTEFGQFLITPQKSLKKSVYHKFVQKDLAVSYIKNDEEVKLIILYQQLVDNLLFLALDGEKSVRDKNGKNILVPKFNPIVDVATVYDSEKLAWLEVWRSRQGFEREKLTTVTHVKKDATTPIDKQSGWFGKNKGG